MFVICLVTKLLVAIHNIKVTKVVVESHMAVCEVNKTVHTCLSHQPPPTSQTHAHVMMSITESCDSDPTSVQQTCVFFTKCPYVH